MTEQQSGTRMIKWQSKLFPKLVLTEEHYHVLHERLPYIESFERELEALELWLDSHPQRVPRRNWKAQVTNWMRIANERGERKRHTGQVLNKSAAQMVKKQVQETKIECHLCGRVHGFYDRCETTETEGAAHNRGSEGTARQRGGLRKGKDGPRSIGEVLGELRRPGTNQSILESDS